MIVVNDILYDKESKEADIELMSKKNIIKCYCHPVETIEEIYTSVNKNLRAFQVKNIVVDNCMIPQAIKTNDGYYSYYLRGRVVSDRKIQIHEFIIDIGVMPKDIKTGEYISCSCLRLDLIV